MQLGSPEMVPGAALSKSRQNARIIERTRPSSARSAPFNFQPLGSFRRNMGFTEEDFATYGRRTERPRRGQNLAMERALSENAHR